MDQNQKNLMSPCIAGNGRDTLQSPPRLSKKTWVGAVQSLGNNCMCFVWKKSCQRFGPHMLSMIMASLNDLAEKVLRFIGKTN